MTLKDVMERMTVREFELLLELITRELPFESPGEPCIDCYRAYWIDMYGTWCYCCDMSHCIMADDEY